MDEKTAVKCTRDDTLWDTSNFIEAVLRGHFQCLFNIMLFLNGDHILAPEHRVLYRLFNIMLLLNGDSVVIHLRVGIQVLIGIVLAYFSHRTELVVVFLNCVYLAGVMKSGV